ncbi:MAG: cyclic nucleotide-binding domain-containing protein [Anaerolineae bacterium]
MDLMTALHQTELFKQCSDEQIQAIAGICTEHLLERNALLCRQSYRGTTYYLIDTGEALVRRVNENGDDRPVGMIKAGDAFGATSLFISEPRDASVITTTPMHLWTLQRTDLDNLMASDPDLWHALTIPADILAKLRAPTLDWLEPGESLVYFCRRHWITAAKPIVILSVLYLALSVALFLTTTSAQPFPAFWIPCTALYLLALIWFWLDWRNDYFAVTTQRIVHHERVIFLFEAREEAPIDRVQNVRIETGLQGSIFGYGNLIVETAAVAGVLRFTTIPRPEEMREAIFTQTNRMLAVNRASQRLQIHDELAKHLGSSDRPGPDTMPVPEGPYTLSDSNSLQLKTKGLARFIESLGKLGIVPRTRIAEKEGITWRKHWLFLISTTIIPFFLSGICGTLVLIGWLNSPSWLGSVAPYFPMIAVAGLIVSFSWFFWRINDWANDLYIVTNDRIIDIERHPLFLSESRREASLGVIQNVGYKQNNLIAKVLNFGDVIVQTAGPGTFTFMHVPNPRDVQREVFHRMEAFRRVLHDRDSAQLHSQLGDWFGTYDKLHRVQRSDQGGDME